MKEAFYIIAERKVKFKLPDGKEKSEKQAIILTVNKEILTVNIKRTQIRANLIIDIIKKHYEIKYFNESKNLIPVYAEDDILCDNDPIGFKEIDSDLLEFEINQNIQIKSDITEHLSLTLEKISKWMDKLENEGYIIKFIKKDKFYKKYKKSKIYCL